MARRSTRPARYPNEPFDDPILELSALARAETDPDMRKRLERLRARVAANALRLYDQRNVAARETIRFGGLLCQKLHDEGHNMELRRKRQDLCKEREGPAHSRCRKGADALTAGEKTLAGNILFFADTVVRAAQNYTDDLDILAGQLETLESELENRNIGDLARYPRSFHSRIIEYASDGRVERDSWYDACVKLR